MQILTTPLYPDQTEALLSEVCVHEVRATAESPPGAAAPDLHAQIQAALALSRATLQAVAAISAAAQSAAEMALETEAERAPRAARRIVEDARDRLAQAPAEAEMAYALHRALVAAADALPSTISAA